MFLRLLAPGASDGPAQRAPHQLADEVPLVVDRSALIGDRVSVFGGDAARLGEVLCGRRLAGEERLRLRGAEMRGADRGQADAGPGDGVALQPYGGTGGRHRPVADSPFDLLVCRAAAGPDR